MIYGICMNKKIIADHIDFNDSEFRSIEVKDELITLYITSWDDRTIKAEFINPIYVTYTFGDTGAFILEVDDKNEVQEKLLCASNEKLNPKYKLYYIEDIYDFTYMKIVAESVNVVKIQEIYYE